MNFLDPDLTLQSEVHVLCDDSPVMYINLDVRSDSEADPDSSRRMLQTT